MSLILAGATSGATTLSPTDAVTTVITLPSSTDTLVGQATTDTLTNKTLGSTVVQASNAAPAFSAYNGSAQSIANNTFTKLQFPTEEFDTNSNYDNATNYRFTPTVAGYYQFVACVNFSLAGGVGTTSFYKNGSEFKRGSQIIGGASIQPNSTALIYCNGTTDYVEAYARQTSGGSLNTQPGSAQVYFQAAMVRSA